MNQNIKGPHQLSCEVCEIESMSVAEYALHEFTKKHCDNLIRLAKNKPILKKQKTKNKVSEVEKETAKVTSVAHTGSFAKYGYFVPGEIYAACKDPKEFNSDYNPYLQKFAENPFKENPVPVVVENSQQQCTTVLPSAVGVSKKKKKKKKNIKMCQICNVTLLTTPLFEAHMKSPEHILKLKGYGMGVSAHFVKASSDLHTTETKDDQKVDKDITSVNNESSNQNSSAEVSLQNCNVCGLPVSSSHEYINDATGKYHIKCFKKKVEDKEILDDFSSDKLFCYTCNIMLNTVFQYNEHKHGKRHKIKCRALIRKGMTVPPEERVPGIGMPSSDPSQPVYPELYVKMIIERLKKSPSPAKEVNIRSSNASCVQELTETQSCESAGVSEKPGDDVAASGIQNEINFTTNSLDSASKEELVEGPITPFHKIDFIPGVTNEIILGDSSVSNQAPELGNRNEEPKSSITVLNIGQCLRCSVCEESFQLQSQFDAHLALEDHLKKIVELKVSGKSEDEILNLLFADRNVVKPNNLGRLTCSICKVTVDSSAEFEQHLSCVVHKYTEKDYKQKRTIEVRHLIPSDEAGMFYCDLCKTKSTSLVEFSQHLFSAKHKTTEKRRKTFRSAGVSQRQRISQNLKRKYILLQSLKAEKNPKVRAKVRGLDVDLCPVAKSNVPESESKIQAPENSSLGAGDKSAPTRAKKSRKASVKARQNMFKAGRKILGRNLMQTNSVPMTPSLLPGIGRPSMNFARFFNRPPSGWLPYPPIGRNPPPVYSPAYSHPPMPRPFYGRPPNAPFYRAPRFQRAPWLNYR